MSVVQTPTPGTRVVVGAGDVHFGSVALAIAGANTDADTAAGELHTRTYTWCFDLDEEPTTCENQILVGIVDLDTEHADLDVRAVTWDLGPYTLSQNTVDASAGGMRAYAIVYGFCMEDASTDGCAYILSFNAVAVVTPAGTRTVYVLVADNGSMIHACAVAVIGACQQVPSTP